MSLKDLELLLNSDPALRLNASKSNNNNNNNNNNSGSMISRTVRYFKLMYIVAGILMSNETICSTVDQIQIAPRVEVKEILAPRRMVRGVERVSRNWFRSSYGFVVGRIKRRLSPIFGAFSIWTIPNYLWNFSSGYISKRFGISSDCDVIYSR